LNVKFLNAVQAAYQKIDGSTFIGELAETLEGLRRPAAALRKGLSGYLKTLEKRSRGYSKTVKRSKRIASLNEMVSGTWLEFSFGVRPLMADIKDAGSAYNSLFDTFGFEKLECHATVKEKQFSKIVEARNVGQFPYAMTSTSDADVSGRMFGFVVRETGRPYTFAERFGLMPENFVPAVWNVLPFSFLADYFVNIGDCLSAGGVSTRNLRVLCLTTRVKRKFHVVASLNQDAVRETLHDLGYYTPTFITSDSTSDYAQDYFRREVLDPRVDLWVVPVLNLPTRNTQFINMTALVSQALGVVQKLTR
jgi:hypothetical protein